MKILSKKKLVTHNGKFHADDVFACAVLLLVLEKEKSSWKIFRTRDKEIVENGDFVFDVGGEYDPDKNRFDHHQIGGAGKRDNGIEYAAFGLVWKKFGSQLCGSTEVAEDIDVKLVSPIDGADNGMDLYVSKFKDVTPYTIFDAIRSFLPTWKEDENVPDSLFLEVVDFAKKILEREIKKGQDKLEAKGMVEKAYHEAKDKRLIVLDIYYPFRDALIQYPEPLFVVTPRLAGKGGGKWDITIITVSKDSYKARKDLPESWAGLTGEALQKVTGVPDAVFCHRGLFLATAGSKEGILKLAELALNN